MGAPVMKQKLISLCLLPLLAFGHWALDFDEDFAAASAVKFPYDREVEYLASTGTQWIDTGVDAWGDIAFEVDIDFTQYYPTKDGNYGICGSYVASGGKLAYVAAIRYASRRYNGGRDGVAYTNAPVADFQGERAIIYIGKTTATINGTVWAGASGNVNESGQTFYLFAVKGYSGVVNGAIHYLKIWKGGDVVIDLIPVRVGTVGYMYDRVSKQLFGNAGTGTFVVGPDK
jgi:hypothetical protein